MPISERSKQHPFPAGFQGEGKVMFQDIMLSLPIGHHFSYTLVSPLSQTNMKYAFQARKHVTDSVVKSLLLFLSFPLLLTWSCFLRTNWEDDIMKITLIGKKSLLSTLGGSYLSWPQVENLWEDGTLSSILTPWLWEWKPFSVIMSPWYILVMVYSGQ